MTSIWRTGLPFLRTKATNATLPSITHARTTQKLPVRLYSQGSYGGESSESKQSKSTRQKEHPGPPAPDVGQNPSNADKTTASSSSGSTSSSSSPSSESRKGPRQEASSQEPYSATTHEAPHDPESPEVHDTSHIPSNKAHPTVSTGQQSPYYDEEGRQVKDVPDDVKRHNEEVENRHDRSFNQLTNKGKVQKGF